jgi:hypothetical protein
MADFGGLIGGIMKGFGGGLEQVGQVELKKQSEMDLRKQMLEMESEKRLREDEITRERAFNYEKRGITELEPLRTSAEVNKQKALIPVKVEEKRQVGAAETDVEAAKEEKLGKLKNQLRLDFEKSFTDVAVERKEKEARRDAAVLIDLAKDKNYTSALQKLTDAKTSQADKTQAAAAALKIKNETTVIELRSQLSKLPDTPQNANARAELRRQIDDLTDRKAPSYSDVSTLANGYLVTANTIERTGTGTEEEKAEAKRYRDLAEQITNAVIQKKLPTATGKETKPSAYAKGEERVIADGPNKGKTAVFDGTGWKLKQ